MNQDLFSILNNLVKPSLPIFKHSFKQTFLPAMLVALVLLVLDVMIYPSKYFFYSI